MSLHDEGSGDFKDVGRDFMTLFKGVVDSSHSSDLFLHKVPRLPITIDDSKAKPGDVRDFMGTPLHTVIDPEALGGKLLRIFSDKDKAESYCRETRVVSQHHSFQSAPDEQRV